MIVLERGRLIELGDSSSVPGTLDRWKDRGRYGVTDYGRDPRARRVRFRISLPTALSVRFDVYDVAGRRLQRLVDRHLPAGDTAVEWDRASAGGASIPSGVYFARLSYQSGSRIAKIPLIR